MSVLLAVQNLAIDHGGHLLFKDLAFSVHQGARMALVGPNGSGKSSLLRVLAGIDRPTDGIITRVRGLVVGYVPQESSPPDATVLDVVLQMQTASGQPADALRAEQCLSRCGLTDLTFPAQQLSGGWKKRLDLAAALALDPDLLLLDEPTNHLDLESIEWLEKWLLRSPCAFVVSSHDRIFLDRVASQTMELNSCFPGGLFIANGPYSTFCELRAQFLEGQLTTERSMASKARRELDWLRRTAPARTTKSSARTGQAHQLLDDLSDVKARNRQKQAQVQFESTERETQKLLVCHNLQKSMGGRELFRNLDVTLSPRCSLALMGPNGCGKSTLLKILAGELDADMGTRKPADDLRIVTFDQHRVQLPAHLTLREALSPHGDFVRVRDQQIHVNGWAQRFLFDPDRLSLPISVLSGGERARILIAHLMRQPADVLLLDEPTNDLDIPTLEVLEQALKDFPGAVVFISHDRALIDALADQVLAFDGAGNFGYFADRAQAQAFLQKKKASGPSKDASGQVSSSSPPPVKKAKALSFKEQRELDGMMPAIQLLDGEILQLEESMSQGTGVELHQRCERMAAALAERDRLYARWAELEAKLS